MSYLKEGSMIILSSPSGAENYSSKENSKEQKTLISQYHTQQENLELMKKMELIIIS